MNIILYMIFLIFIFKLAYKVLLNFSELFKKYWNVSYMLIWIAYLDKLDKMHEYIYVKYFYNNIITWHRNSIILVSEVKKMNFQKIPYNAK